MLVFQYGSLAGRTGGPAHSLYLMGKGLCEAGIGCSVLMPPIEDGDKLYGSDVPVRFLPRCHGHFQYVFGAQRFLDRLPRPDLCHIHGLWQYPNHAVCVYARRNRLPYLVSPRGMLYRQGIDGHSRLIKRAALLLWQHRDLADASCIHATCEDEMKVCREMGFRNPIAVIPNAVELPAENRPPSPPGDVFRVGYLGRLHPRKHVEALIRGFAAAAIPGSQLQIIGSGDVGYEEFLRQECRRLDLRNVGFSGFLHGEEKRSELRRLSVLVVPSDYENFGNVVVEALAEGIPVVASRGTPWSELEQCHCGFWIKNSPEEIANALLKISKLPLADRVAMGAAGQRLVVERYSVDQTTRQWLSVYRWLVGDGPRPCFVCNGRG